MSTYIAIYNGSMANGLIKRTLTYIGNRPDVILLDLLLDGQCIELSNELKNMGYNCKITESRSARRNDVSFSLSAIMNDVLVKKMETGGKPNEEFLLEVGELDHILSGAVYSAAFREGATVVYVEDERRLEKVQFEKAPDIGRVGYYMRATLEALYEYGNMDYDRIKRQLYADRIIGMDEAEIDEFFSQNHNTYKVLQKLVEKKWVRYNKERNLYEITELGNMTRVMLNLKTEKDRQRTS